MVPLKTFLEKLFKIQNLRKTQSQKNTLDIREITPELWEIMPELREITPELRRAILKHPPAKH